MKVAPLISRIEMERAHFRPFLSPMFPQNTAPIGRTRNAIANTANAYIVATALSTSGKNATAMTVARYE